jgi:hypothetical protein
MRFGRPPHGTLTGQQAIEKDYDHESLGMIPTLILFLFIQKYMVSGATALFRLYRRGGSGLAVQADVANRHGALSDSVDTIATTFPRGSIG